MNVQIKWFNDNFNVAISSSAGKDPFIEIKGCRIVDGRNGPFVSYPSRKQDDGKYWNHVYGSDAFNAVVLSKAQESMPQRQAPAPRQQQAQRPAAAPQGSGFDDMSDDIPFVSSAFAHDTVTSKARRMARYDY